MTDSYTFKLGVNLSETGESFERAVELAQELGAGYAEFFVNDRAQFSAAGAAPYRRRLEAHGLRVHGIGCTPNPFKELHIDELDLADIPTHPTFRHDLDLLRRSIDFCQGVGGANVRVHGFAWPGEYQQGSAGQPDLAAALRHRRRGHRSGDTGQARQGVEQRGRTGRAPRDGHRHRDDAVELHQHEPQLPPDHGASRLAAAAVPLGAGRQLQLRGSGHHHGRLPAPQAVPHQPAPEGPPSARRAGVPVCVCAGR